MASRARRHRSPSPNDSEGGDGDGHGDVGESSNPKDPRIAIEIEDGNLTEPNKVSRNSTKIFKKSLHEEGLTWGLVPNEKKLEYFEEFEKLFSWNRAHDSAVRDLWMAKAGPLYNNMLCKARKKGKRPAYMSEPLWTAWNAKWKTEEY